MVGGVGRSIIAAGSVLLFTELAFSSECSDQQLIQAQKLVEITGRQIVDGNIGGLNVQSTLNSCVFDDEDQSFAISMTVGWNGVIWRKRYYEISGELLTSESGSNAEFLKISSNERAESLSFWGNLGSIILDLSNEN